MNKHVVGTLANIPVLGESQASKAGTSCISWTVLLCSDPGTLVVSFPAVSEPDLPQQLEWSGPCWQQVGQQMCVLFWLGSNYRGLVTSPHGTEVCWEFGKPMLRGSHSLTPPSLLQPSSLEWHNCQWTSTKVPVMAASDYQDTFRKSRHAHAWRGSVNNWN